jgi:hypothetical protein
MDVSTADSPRPACFFHCTDWVIARIIIGRPAGILDCVMKKEKLLAHWKCSSEE